MTGGLCESVTNEFLESVYDSAIRSSTSDPDISRACGHSRIEYEKMIQNGHAGRIRKKLEEGELEGWAPYRRSKEAKDDGGTRTIDAPSWDVHLASAAYSSYYSDVLETPSAFFGRAKETEETQTGVHAARRRTRRLAEGRWCVRTDIVDFFGSVPHDHLEELLREALDPRDVPLLLHLLRLPSIDSAGNCVEQWDEGGIPQGNPVSPLVARLLLWELPRQLSEGGHVPLIYVDDLFVASSSKARAVQALKRITDFMSARGLEVSPSLPSDAVIAPWESFSFLGEQFPKDCTPRKGGAFLLRDVEDGHRGQTDPGGDRPTSGCAPDPDSSRVRYTRYSGATPSLACSAPDIGGSCSTGEGPPTSPPSTPVLPSHPIPHQANRGPARRNTQSAECFPFPTQPNPTLPLCIRLRRPIVPIPMQLQPLQTSTEETGQRVNEGRADDSAGQKGQDKTLQRKSDLSPEGKGIDSLPLTAWWTEDECTPEVKAVLREWINAAGAVAALAGDVDRYGIVSFGDHQLEGSNWDFVASGDLSEQYPTIEYPPRPKDSWAPDVLVLPVPSRALSKDTKKRRQNVEALVCRARKALLPGGVLLAVAGSDDHSAQIAFESIPADDLQPIGAHVLGGVQPGTPDVHIRLWQRDSASMARTLGSHRRPWLRVLRRPQERYEVGAWSGDTLSTCGHPYLKGRIPRPRAAMYDVLADAIEGAVRRGARHLSIVHHGDVQTQFFTAVDGDEVWTPRKSDLVRPVRRLKGLLRELPKVFFYCETRAHGINWDQPKVLCDTG